MPRKPLIYTHLYPYHITARANNREWFNLQKSLIWQIMCDEASKICERQKFLIHAFVLMENHYHMIASADEYHPLGVFQFTLGPTD